jgi:ubiquinone/menaquinone biosynthesis C-methylase UbiE
MGKYTDEFVKQVNAAFHQVEAACYDVRHPEIFIDEVRVWTDNIIPVLAELDIHTGLDVGTGTGFVAALLADRLDGLLRLICYDITPTMLVAAREAQKSDIGIEFNFIVGDAERLPISQESVDLVCANSVLHHLPAFDNMLREVDRVLRTGGAFVLAHEPNRLFFQRKANIVSPYDLYRLLRKLGAPVLRTERRDQVFFRRVNQQLKANGLVQADLTPTEIASIVDFHSPSAGGFEPDRGFTPKEIIKRHFPAYRLLALKTYRHLGKIATGRAALDNLGRMLARLLPDYGMHFFWILKKQ